MNEQIVEDSAFNEQPDPSLGIDQADVYKLSADKLFRNNQKIERRKFKYRVTDRRSQMRQTADGAPQTDRRRANRVAYAEMYAKLKKPQ